MMSLIVVISFDAHQLWPQEPVKTEICESKSVSVFALHADKVIFPPLPGIVYQRPGAVGSETELQLGAWISTVLPFEVDPEMTSARVIFLLLRRQRKSR
jgi:hypothetical protein